MGDVSFEGPGRMAPGRVLLIVGPVAVPPSRPIAWETGRRATRAARVAAADPGDGANPRGRGEPGESRGTPPPGAPGGPGRRRRVRRAEASGPVAVIGPVESGIPADSAARS